VNNNQPEFLHETYSVEVPEDAKIGSYSIHSRNKFSFLYDNCGAYFVVGQIVTQVNGMDEDRGVNADLTYRVEKGAFNDFDIDKQTGFVRVKSKLDYDKRDVYNITVIATDAGWYP